MGTVHQAAPKPASRFDPTLALAVGFVVVFVLASALASRIALPFSNPQGIVGTLTGIHYNPSNNIVRFLLITLSPTLALAAAFFLLPRPLASQLFPGPSPEAPRERDLPIARRRLFLLPVIAIALLIALDTQSYMSAGEFETFEEGQPLSAGMSYLDGGTPYRDFSCFHGLYEEPLRAAAAFALFGPSIGALRTLQSVNKIITFGFLTWFLVRAFHGNVGFVLLVLFALHQLQPQGMSIPLNRAGIRGLHPVLIVPRDMALFAFLTMLPVLAARIHRPVVAERGIFWFAAGWSALPGLAFIHSMERGVYLLVAFIAIGALCHVLFFRGSAQARRFLLGCTAGLVFSVVLLAVLIRGAFSDLARLTALLASDAIQLQFGHPYPFTAKRYIVISLMMAFNCFWVARMFFIHWQHAEGPIEGLRSFLRHYLVEASLLLVSMLFYKNALGRSDWFHVAYVLPVPIILFSVIVLRHVLAPVWRQADGPRVAGLKTAFVAASWIVFAVGGLVLLSHVPRENLLRKNFPLGTADDSYLPDRWKRLVSFLRSNLSPNEHFYTLSDELSIYYFVGKPCPVRFPLLDMVVKDNQYQREIIADLEAHRVKYIVWDPQSIYFQIDGFSNELRAPLVFDYVRTHYEHYAEMDGQLVLIRKASQG